MFRHRSKDRRGRNIEMLDKNREVLSPSVPSLYWHKSFAPYQAAYVCLPSPSIHPCSSVPSRHTGTEDSNTLPEKLCQEEKVEKLVKITQVMQRQEGNRTSYAFPTAPFSTFSCGGNGAFRALALATAFLDLAVKFSCVCLKTKKKKEA